MTDQLTLFTEETVIQGDLWTTNIECGQHVLSRLCNRWSALLPLGPRRLFLFMYFQPPWKFFTLSTFMQCWREEGTGTNNRGPPVRKGGPYCICFCPSRRYRYVVVCHVYDAFG
jgi:hypothetical protein